MEHTNNYIASHFDPNSHKSHPPPDPSAQTPKIAHQSTCQPPVNETAFNPHNPFNQKSWMHVFQNDPSYSSNVHRFALNHDNFDYIYVPPVTKVENPALYEEFGSLHQQVSRAHPQLNILHGTWLDASW